MKTIVMLTLVLMLTIVAAPAYAAEARQMWKCQMNEEASEEEVQALLGEWLKAARTMKGGERLELYAFFPVAVNDIGEYDLWVVLHAPSFVEWGQFWDGYTGSPADEAEGRCNEKFVCPDSALWESIKIK